MKFIHVSVYFDSQIAVQLLSSWSTRFESVNQMYSSSNRFHFESSWCCYRYWIVIMITKFWWIVWIAGVKQWFQAEWNVAMPIAFSHPVRTLVDKKTDASSSSSSLSLSLSPIILTFLKIDPKKKILIKEPPSTDVEHDIDNGCYLHCTALLTNLTYPSIISIIVWMSCD